MKILLNMMVLVCMPVMAMAQINSDSADLIFTTNGSEVVRMTTTGVLDISGSIKLKNNTATCNGSTEGILRYNSGDVELCDATSWKAIPTYPIGYFVLSSSTWNGNLGGAAGAAALCLTELTNENWLGKADATISASTVEAFILNPTITPNADYRFATAGDITAGGSSFITDSAGVGPNNTNTWAGATYFNVSTSYWTGWNGNNSLSWGPIDATTVYDCNGFTNSTTSFRGERGRSASASRSRWNLTSRTCNSTYQLICIVNPA
jgi:hypothetical protein